MFKFFRKRQEQRQAKDEKAETFRQVIAQFEKGKGNALEAALVLQLAAPDKESLPRLLMQFGSSDLWILNKVPGRLGDPAVTEGADGHPYVAAFTSRERALSAAAEWNLANQPCCLHALELVFALTPAVGIVLNANDLHLQWTFAPEQVSNLRTVFEKTHNCEAGGIYSVWSQDSYGIAKLLVVDEGGVHLRIYGNRFSERPAEVDPASLSLDASDGDSMRSLGHIPLVRTAFLAMGPKLMATEPIGDDELDGYKIWADANGGYFSS